MRLDDIDWNAMWQEARQRKSWKKKNSADWDRRAAGFARRNIDSDYAAAFLSLLRPEPDWRILDVGCGPGTLALPLARRVREVTALDFSAAMLEELGNRAAAENIGSIRMVQGSWTDDWQALAIPPHEVVISSRSLSVSDLGAALEKLDRWATIRVVVADRVGSGPFDPELFAAVGRPFDPGPDYIYTVNLLYRMGIHPTINYIAMNPIRLFSDRNQALASCRWMIDDLSADEEKKLSHYLDERLEPDPAGMWRLTRSTPVKWAVISWEK